MKTLLQAINLTTAAFGNVVVMVVANAKLFEQVNSSLRGESDEKESYTNQINEFLYFKFQAHEFFLFGTLMVLDMALLALIAFNYKPVAEAVDVEEVLPPSRKISVASITSSSSMKTAPPPSGHKKSALLNYLASNTKEVIAEELPKNKQRVRKNTAISMGNSIKEYV